MTLRWESNTPDRNPFGNTFNETRNRLMNCGRRSASRSANSLPLTFQILHIKTATSVTKEKAQFYLLRISTSPSPRHLPLLAEPPAFLPVTSFVVACALARPSGPSPRSRRTFELGSSLGLMNLVQGRERVHFLRRW